MYSQNILLSFTIIYKNGQKQMSNFHLVKQSLLKEFFVTMLKNYGND
jgi:hypothetical protein